MHIFAENSRKMENRYLEENNVPDELNNVPVNQTVFFVEPHIYVGILYVSVVFMN